MYCVLRYKYHTYMYVVFHESDNVNNYNNNYYVLLRQ